MAYAMGDRFALWTALNTLIPPLRWWRVPPRVWFIAALIWPYLAGWGMQLLAAHPPDRRAARLLVVGIFGGGVACGLFSTLALSEQLDPGTTLGIFALPITALVMLLATFRKASRRVLMVAFTLVVIADVLWIDQSLIEGWQNTCSKQGRHAYIRQATACHNRQPSTGRFRSLAALTRFSGKPMSKRQKRPPASLWRGTASPSRHSDRRRNSKANAIGWPPPTGMLVCNRNCSDSGW